MAYKYRVYLHGLVAALINGVSNSVVVVMVDPMQFNLFQGGFAKLATVAAASAVMSFFTYLKDHPLPDPEKDNDFAVVHAKAVAQVMGTGETSTGDGTTVTTEVTKSATVIKE